MNAKLAEAERIIARRAAKHSGGKPATKTDIIAKAAKMHGPTMSWGEIAISLLPQECNQDGVKKAGNRLRLAVLMANKRRRNPPQKTL